MSKCYFCGEETKGRKFVGKNFLTREREKFDICENCCCTDLEDEDQMGLSGGHEEYLAEAREWLEEVKKLAGLAKDEKWYQKRLNTLEWLIQQAEEAEKYEDIGIRHERLKNEYLELQRKATEFIEKLEAKVEQHEKALYVLYKMADDGEADLMIDVLVDTLKGYGLEKHFEEMYREGKQQFMEAGW